MFVRRQGHRRMSYGAKPTKHVGQFPVQGPKGAGPEHVCAGCILAVSRAVVHARAYTSGRTFQPNYNCFRLPARVQWSGVPSRRSSMIYTISAPRPSWPLLYTPGRVLPKMWCTSSQRRRCPGGSWARHVLRYLSTKHLAVPFLFRCAHPSALSP